MIKQDEHAPGTTPPPGTDQPPPPGDEQLEHPPLQQQTDEGPSPVGEEEVPIDDVPELQKEESEAEESVKASKKKKKKSKKHRKKKDASSSDDDDKNLIMTLKKLQKLQKEKEAENNNPDIEDGEVQSGEEDNAPNKSALSDIKIEEMISQLKKKKKKHKKDKRKRKRKGSSSDEAPERSSSKKLPPQMTPPAYSEGILQMSKQQQGGEYESHDYHQFHTSTYNQPSYNDTDQRNKASPRAHHYAARDDQYGKYRGYGAGEPIQHHSRLDKFITGPEGDHSSSTGVQQRKQMPSPLPMIVPDDPNPAEMWEMQKRYDERMQQQRVSVSTANVNTQQLKQIVQTAGLVREQQRSAAIYHQDGRPSPHDHRKRPPTDSSAMKTKRQKRSYQDWDRPGDDNSQVYYYSGSEGSDKEYNRDERSPMKRGGDHEPRIIPVIGGSSKPQPIPTLASNRALGPASMQPQQQQQQQRLNPADPYYRGRYDYGGGRRDDMGIVGGGGPRMPFSGGPPGGSHRTMMMSSHDGVQMLGRHHAPPARNPPTNFQYDALPPGINRRPPHGMP